MSLTDHLKDPGSPVRAYLDGISPWLSDIQGSAREAQAMAQALGLDGLARSRTLVPPRPGVDAARSGTAVDFRVRIALGAFDPQDSAAAQGVALLPRYAGEIHNGAHRAQVLAEAFDMAVRILDAPLDESEFDRACLLLAHCEQVYRAGAPALAGSLGEALDAAGDGPDFARRIDEPSLSDLRALMIANASQIDVWHRSIADGERFEPNPSFVGSALVGGADADWIVGDTLIDSKAYEKLTVATLRDFFRQLLGYVMLDFEDDLGIRSVGIWLPRQGVTRAWSLDRLLDGDSEELLPKLRAGFRTAVGGSQLAVREKASQRRKHQILADNKHTPGWMLVDLALSADSDLRFRVGRNAATPEELVRKLARDRYAKVREGVARNERAPVEVLDELSHDRSVVVRRAVESNPCASKELAGTIGTSQSERSRPGHRTAGDSALLPASTALARARIHQERDTDLLDTRWIARLFAVDRGAVTEHRNFRIPVPAASERWARQEGQSLDIPDWLKAGLPEAVKHDLMRENRSNEVRRMVADRLPVSDPTLRDSMLTDADPEVRWSALRRTVAYPDEALAGLLGCLAADRQERRRFRLEGDRLSAQERNRISAIYDRETLALVASHPSTPQTALSRLLELKSSDVLVGLVENPALPASDLAAVLPRVKSIRSHELRARLAGSKNLPATVATVFTGDRNIDVRLALARNGAIPSEVLDELAEDPEPLVRLATAMNEGFSVERATTIVESQLASARDGELLEALRVAGSRDDLEPDVELLVDALDRLSKSRVREPDMRVIVAEDKRACPRTLARLARSADDLVRCTVAENGNAPAEVLTDLGSDSVSSVRASAAANTSLEPGLLAELLQDHERHVRTAAYRNPSTRSEDRARVEVAWERTRREATPSRAEYEERAASKRAEVRTQVAFDPRTPTDILVLLGGERRSVAVRRAVAANANTPPEVLASLAEDKDAQVRRAVAFNRSTPQDLLADLAGRNVDLALLVAFNPKTPTDALHALAEDADLLVGHIAAGVSVERTELTTNGGTKFSRRIQS